MTTSTGQVSKSAAEVYEEFFLPALFSQWAASIIDVSRPREGDSFLDVACGTGVLARAALGVVGPSGRVTGLDINPEMLDVARSKEPGVTWVAGPAESLPFETASFDIVASQFGLMFFEDRARAIREMTRVVRPSGVVVIAVWDSLENTPGYRAAVELLSRLFGDAVADGLRAPFNLGDRAALRQMLESAGANGAEISTLHGEARFPSIESWMYTDIRGWTMSDDVSDLQFETLVDAAKKDLRRFVRADGTVQFEMSAHVAVVRN